jgi:hypothetical protein
MAQQQISQAAPTSAVLGKKIARMLTERFFLYRLVVFCPEKTRTSTASEHSEEQQTAEDPKNWEVIKLNQVGTAPEALLGVFRYQAKQAKFLWGVERMTHRGLPDNFDPVRRRALAAKQIDSKLVAN